MNLFRRDPLKKAQTAYQLKLKEAMKAQRSGDIRSYSRLSAEASSLLQDLEAVQVSAQQ